MGFLVGPPRPPGSATHARASSLFELCFENAVRVAACALTGSFQILAVEMATEAVTAQTEQRSEQASCPPCADLGTSSLLQNIQGIWNGIARTPFLGRVHSPRTARTNVVIS